MIRRPVKLGLVGAGRWGQILIRAISAHPAARLTWVASRNPMTRSLVAADAIVVSDWNTFPAADIDGVVIASPPELHYDMVRLAIDSGVPAFVEKPLTTSLADARDLAARAAANQALVLVDHTQLFQPGYQRLRKLVAGARGCVAVQSEGGQLGRRVVDVGALWDYGPHDVAMCLDLIGRDARVTSAEYVEVGQSPSGPVENVRLCLDWPNGSWANAVVGNLMPIKRRRFAVTFGDRTYLLDDLAENPLIEYPAMAPMAWPGPETVGRPINVSRDLPLDCAIERFAEGIRGEQSGHPEFGLDLAVDVVGVLTAAEAVI